MEESEYETFIGRLNTFNDWPSEAPDYIKDLVEAGFVYTGQGYSVQCFRCHITVSEWKDEDKPLLVHEDLNKNCSYLRERRQKRASTLSLVPSADELNGREVVSQPQVNGHHIVEHQREIETSMLEEANRYQTFASCPVNKHWPPVEELARCGFYWVPKLEHMQCFSCNLIIDNWDSPDQDVALKHRSKSPNCTFMHGRSPSSLSENDSIPLDNNLYEAFRHMQVRAEVWQHRIHDPDSDMNRYDDNQHIPPNGQYIFVPPSAQNHMFPTQQIPTIPPQSLRYTQLTRSLSEYRSRPDNFPPTRILHSQYSSGSCVSEYADRNKRLSTFLTWSKYAPVQPAELCDAGFYYTLRDDSVRCYICELALRQWEPGDKAWSEHEKFSPNCPLVISHRRKLLALTTQTKTNHFSGSPRGYPTVQTSSSNSAGDSFERPSRFQGNQSYHTRSPVHPESAGLHLNQTYRLPSNNQVNFYRQSSFNERADYNTNYQNPMREQTASRMNERPAPPMSADLTYQLNHTNPLLQQYLLENQYLTTSPSACGDQESVSSSSSASEKSCSLNGNRRYFPASRNLTPPPIYQALTTSSSSPNATQQYMISPPKYHTAPQNSSINPYIPKVSSQDSFSEVSSDDLEKEKCWKAVGTSTEPQSKNNFKTDENQLKQTKAILNKRVSDSDIDDLLELGLSEQLIRDTIACYREYSPQNFKRRDDLIQAALYFQKHKSLEGTPFGRKLTVDQEVVDSCSMIIEKVDPNKKQDKEVTETEKNCRICLDNDVEVTLIPCGHFCLCQSCTFGLKECPICRRNIESIQRTYFYGN